MENKAFTFNSENKKTKLNFLYKNYETIFGITTSFFVISLFVNPVICLLYGFGFIIVSPIALALTSLCPFVSIVCINRQVLLLDHVKGKVHFKRSDALATEFELYKLLGTYIPIKTTIWNERICFRGEALNGTKGFFDPISSPLIKYLDEDSNKYVKKYK